MPNTPPISSPSSPTIPFAPSGFTSSSAQPDDQAKNLSEKNPHSSIKEIYKEIIKKLRATERPKDLDPQKELKNLLEIFPEILEDVRSLHTIEPECSNNEYYWNNEDIEKNFDFENITKNETTRIGGIILYNNNYNAEILLSDGFFYPLSPSHINEKGYYLLMDDDKIIWKGHLDLKYKNPLQDESQKGPYSYIKSELTLCAYKYIQAAQKLCTDIEAKFTKNHNLIRKLEREVESSSSEVRTIKMSIGAIVLSILMMAIFIATHSYSIPAICLPGLMFLIGSSIFISTPSLRDAQKKKRDIQSLLPNIEIIITYINSLHKIYEKVHFLIGRIDEAKTLKDNKNKLEEIENAAMELEQEFKQLPSHQAQNSPASSSMSANAIAAAIV